MPGLTVTVATGHPAAVIPACLKGLPHVDPDEQYSDVQHSALAGVLVLQIHHDH
jgi:hypothetical protein